jgi:hypothetical protein
MGEARRESSSQTGGRVAHLARAYRLSRSTNHTRDSELSKKRQECIRNHSFHNSNTESDSDSESYGKSGEKSSTTSSALIYPVQLLSQGWRKSVAGATLSPGNRADLSAKFSAWLQTQRRHATNLAFLPPS